MLRGLRRLIPAPMLLVATALLAGAVLACGDDDDDEGAGTGAGATDATAPAASEPLKVVTSTGILAHFAEQVAGDDAEVVAVIPAGADTHTFSASTGDIRNIAAADVVIVNGFNLEEGTLNTIFEHIPDDARLVIAAAGIQPLEGGHHEEEEDDHGAEEEGEDHGDEDEEEGDHGDEEEGEGHDEDADEDEGEDHGDEDADEGEDHGDEEEGDEHGDEAEGDDHAEEDDHAKAEAPAGAELAVADGDPHMWLTVPNAMIYVRNIADGLAAADPDNAAAYRQRSEAYLAELQALDEEVRAAVAGIPAERRVLIVYHDAFQYFAAEYGLELAAAVLPASPSQQASAAAVAEIIEIVAGRDVGAVFREPQFAADALEAIAEEAGVGVSVLYSGAFTDQVNTYVDLMRFNARSLVEGLGGG